MAGLAGVPLVGLRCCIGPFTDSWVEWFASSPFQALIEAKGRVCVPAALDWRSIAMDASPPFPTRRALFDAFFGSQIGRDGPSSLALHHLRIRGRRSHRCRRYAGCAVCSPSNVAPAQWLCLTYQRHGPTGQFGLSINLEKLAVASSSPNFQLQTSPPSSTVPNSKTTLV
jgi:hypothetical protein